MYTHPAETAKKYEGQKNEQPSMTIPDQTMSLREILTRYAKGLPIDGEKVPIWEGEEGFDIDPDKLDLAEREELAEKAREELKAINERIKDAVNKKKSKKNDGITDIEIEKTSEDEKKL